MWRGEPLQGKCLLVRCCYGLGDTLQFIRYAALLRNITFRITVQMQTAIAPVVECVEGIDDVITSVRPLATEAYDVVIESTELPHVLRTTSETIPARIRYIHIPPRSLSPASGLRIGLVWHGSDWDLRRAIPLQLFAGFARIPGVALHVLQRGTALLQRPPDFGIDSGSDDVYEAARTIGGLDLMITIDSMPAHLAGAMGVPTWVMLHSEADWRWMEKRTDSPWYPTMRLFRQKNADDWAPVIAHVKYELERVATSPSRSLSLAA